MFRMSSIAELAGSVTVTSTLALTTIVFSPSKTLSQTPSNGRNNTVPQVGCLSGYGNDTYRGSRPVTRYEFAAGLNSCLNQVNQVIPANRADLATKEDLEILLNRQRQLNQQLRELNERVDNQRTTK
ncbi:S-layer homology domain-containing protein [Nostoc sp. MS1]|uniref:S-layer homology domain-containing protein n=1 Tax=Nostoc sp. MS1 TaxID=2764711 RepID=UPI001CC70A33|nr:S-layer homology domain-containing protein [Nostoc sp. MS1]BCL38045.1 hypothetical protein NSMS1_44920 [Nostoc sp. MS1]